MSEWKEYKLEDVATIQTGPFGSQLHQSDYVNNGTPIITVEHLGDNRITCQNLPKVTDWDKERLKKYHLQEGDVVFSRVGSVDRRALVSKQEDGWLFSGRCLRVRADEKLANGAFLSYYFGQENFKEYIRRIAVGATMPSINTKILSEILIRLPNLPTQTAIAEILSSLDDKIELNNKINQELENLAQTLFKQWFIDFEFPNENGNPYKSSGGEMVDSELGEIPKGWVLDSLDKIADFLNGLALQKFPAASDFDFLPIIKIRELRQKDTTNSDKASSAIPAKYIIHNGDVLFSWSGTLMVDFWTNGKGALNQHLFKVTSNQFPKWFYYLWTKHHLSEFIKIAESKATTMGHIQRQHLSDAKVVIPNEINNFSVIIEPFITKIINNRIESFELIQLRDSLLPKLISGELEVKQTIN